MGFNISAFGLVDNRLPDGWTIDRIDALADINPEQIGSGYKHSTIAYLDIGNVASGSVGRPEMMPLKDAPSRAKRIVQPKDTILSTVRPGNRAYAFVREVLENLIVSTGFAVLRARSSADPRFLYYLTTSTPLIDYWASIAEEKSAYPSVNPSDIAECVVPIPPLPEQRAIAHILGTLDDKIELNRRMSETLEAMARALFKSWFVDFLPVRAKAAVRRDHPKWTDDQVTRAACPKLKPEIARLFPDSFEDSELGEIPKGWTVGTLGDIAEHPRRGVQPESIEPNTPYIALEHMPRRSIALHGWGLADGLESNKFEFRKGEILFGKLRSYFHKVGVAPVDGVCSTDIVVIAPKSWRWFGLVLGHTSSVEFVEYTNAGSTGTKMPRTRWADMARYEVVLPSEPVAEAFSKLVQPLIYLIITSIHESRTLAALRDALLPKLISGELRVKDAEKFIGKVA